MVKISRARRGRARRAAAGSFAVGVSSALTRAKASHERRETPKVLRVLGRPGERPPAGPGGQFGAPKGGRGVRRGARRNGRKAVCKSGIKTMARWFGAIARALSVATGCYGGEISAFRVSARGKAPGGRIGAFFRGASDQKSVETGGGAVGRAGEAIGALIGCIPSRAVIGGAVSGDDEAPRNALP